MSRRTALRCFKRGVFCCPDLSGGRGTPLLRLTHFDGKGRITMSMDRLIERIQTMKNPSVAGLDTKLDYIPRSISGPYLEKFDDPLAGAAEAILEFNRGMIDALCDVVPAVKPQAAYYEMYGWQGVRALAETIAYARKKGMYVILDGKRNDIGATMEAYTAAHLGRTLINGAEVAPFNADSLTVNGYLGTDGISPLLDACRKYDKSIFVLAKTSNPSSGELQDQKLDGIPVYQAMGEMCERWGSDTVGKYGYSAVGAVVGATYPEQLTELREKLPHTFFLVPGYGAQGGGAAGLRGAFDQNGIGAVVNSSRAILTAWQKKGAAEKDYAVCAREEALRMREDILGAIQ